jgi:hypothetical protein
MRAFGCLLMSLMPESGLEDAVREIFDAYQFALDDDALMPIRPIETIRTGVVVGVLPSDAGDLLA